jgi:hypothetical protein
MKKSFLTILLAGLTTAAFAQEAVQGEFTTTTTTTPGGTGQLQREIEKPRGPLAAPLVPTEGVIQQALKTGQPVQLINPAAPAQYGSGHEHASHDPKNPGKPKGIVLWSFVF